MQLNSLIMAIKPLITMVLNLNKHWIPWILIISFITAHLAMKMNINDVLCQKTVTCLATFLCYCPPERRHAKSFCMRDALMKNLTTKKLWHSKLSKLDPQASRFLGIMFYKCIIDRRKSCFDFNGITALSLL